jgi:hypothetical protein
MQLQVIDQHLQCNETVGWKIGSTHPS